MKSHAKVVVIGGGVVGCSVLYHLARLGWTDVVLLERDELTSGSTWHAAGGMHTINGDPNVAKLQKYTIDLYKEIEALSGQATGVHLTGGVLLAATEARFDWLEASSPRAATSASTLEDHLARTSARTDAAARPQAASSARSKPRSTAISILPASPMPMPRPRASSGRRSSASPRSRTSCSSPTACWRVITNKGDMRGRACRQCRRPLGARGRPHGRARTPVLAMEHMYLITEDMPEVAAINAHDRQGVMHAVDFDGELYLRQERGGMLMGTYEKACKPWSEHVTPWNFGHELLAPDIDRIAPSLEVGFRHFPAFQNTGIKQIINGPFTFAPDGNPLVGPVRGLPGYWCACGVMAGFSQGGGVGLALSNWMIAWRSRHRRLGHGRGALRRLGQQGLHQCQGARELFAALFDPLPQRGTAGRRGR